MIKLKIVHKGLILVAVPLLFGTAFISVLFSEFLESNRATERELMLKDTMITYVNTKLYSIGAARCSACVNITKDTFYAEQYKNFNRKAQYAHNHLKDLINKDPVLRKIGALYYNSFSLKDQTNSPFLQKLQRLSDKQTKAALDATYRLQVILIGGMLTSVIVSVLLTVYFTLNIRNRLLIILNNTVGISKGVPPSAPLAGHDEIAALDRFLFKSATEIRELERFKREMIAVVSHELKSPLSSVGAFLSSLSSGVFGELSSKAKDKAERTSKSAQRLMGLVRELLYLDRLELEMNPESIKVDEIINTSIDTVKELAEQSGIELVVESDGGTLVADRNRLVQVIVNLLSNAMKFSPDKGKVTLKCRQRDGSFEFRVSDQGRGIPEEFQKKIFEPFKQIDSADAASKKGTGLGLTISKSIIEQHAGTIGVDSALNQGSTFWFTVPSSNQHAGNPKSTEMKNPLQSSSAAGADGKFKIREQGLVIIAVPLIFQLAFSVLTFCQIDQVRIQTKREMNSQMVLTDITYVLDILLGATQSITMYTLTKSPESKKAWDSDQAKIFNLVEHSTKIAADDAEQSKDLKEIKAVLKQMVDTMEMEAGKNLNNEGLQRLLKTGVMDAMNKLITLTGGLGSKSMSETMSEVNELLISSGADHEMGTLEMMEGMKSSLNGMMNSSKVSFKGVRVLERLMNREKSRGIKLSKDRSKMIAILDKTLLAGILLNAGLTVLLALTIMRSLTNRLHHVTENTARMVKKEPLDPPLTGSDEIALLDRTLYETGMHLLELELFKRELIAIVSHELRTPLLSVSSALELFENSALGEISEKGRNRLIFAQIECNRLIRLINDLLDIEKMDAGKFILDKTQIKVDELIANSISAVAQLADQKQIQLELSSIVGADTTLNADRDRITQVLINLLSNAIKFSPESGSIKISVLAQNAQCEFRVCDQGRGIPEELKHKIFDRFVQVEKSDETLRGGSGLGLTISKAIVEQHGGTIGVESRLGQGSTFWFQLPLTELSRNEGKKDGDVNL